MNEMIIVSLRWIWLLSIVTVLFKVSYAGVELIQGRIKQTMIERAVQQRIETQLRELSPMEQRVLNYVRSGNDCGVWVSELDAGVQTLLHKGILEQVGEVSRFDDWYGEREICILVMLSPEVEKYGKG